MPMPRATIAGLVAVAAMGLLAAGGAAATPGGILLGAPGLGALLAIAGAIGLLVWSGAAAAAPWVCLGLLPLAWCVGALALTGPPLWALFLGATAAILSAAPRRVPDALFFPIVLALYLVAAHNVQKSVGPEGDEPHYLMVADSLLHDHDLDVTRDYAEGRYKAFHPLPLEPHFRIRGRAGQIYSIHALGLSLLVLPAYALGGYPAASFFMALLAALLARELRRTLLAFDVAPGRAMGVAWVVALSAPLLHYVGLIFTELPAALLVAFGLRWARRAAELDGRRALVLGLALGFLPWLNVRYALFPVVLLVYALGRGLSRRSLAIALGPLCASAVAIGLYHFALYGFFDPRLVYGRNREFSILTLREGLPGLFLDQEFGLLIYAPVFVLVVPGLVGLWGVSRRDALALATLIALVVLTAGSWDMWRGGFNPPGRFLVPLLPLLAVGLAYGIRAPLRAPAALLVGVSLWIGLSGAARPELVHRDRDGTAPFFRVNSGAEEWTRLLPGFVMADPDRVRLALVWGAALAAAVASQGVALRRRDVALAMLGLVTACSAASHLSHARTEGRDAGRLLGQPAAVLPGGRIERQARWTPAALAWGPMFEPHRHPDGATIGNRLRLTPGAYRIRVGATDSVPLEAPPSLLILPEHGGEGRSVLMEQDGQGWRAAFEVGESGRQGLRLALDGGAPFELEEIALALQPAVPSAVQ